MIEITAYGQVLCDMHDGLKEEILQTYEVTNRVCMLVSGGGEIIESLVRQEVPEFKYINKLLVVVADNPGGGHVCAYSYDDRRLVFLSLVRRG